MTNNSFDWKQSERAAARISPQYPITIDYSSRKLGMILPLFLIVAFITFVASFCLIAIGLNTRPDPAFFVVVPLLALSFLAAVGTYMVARDPEDITGVTLTDKLQIKRILSTQTVDWKDVAFISFYSSKQKLESTTPQQNSIVNIGLTDGVVCKLKCKLDEQQEIVDWLENSSGSDYLQKGLDVFLSINLANPALKPLVRNRNLIAGIYAVTFAYLLFNAFVQSGNKEILGIFTLLGSFPVGAAFMANYERIAFTDKVYLYSFLSHRPRVIDWENVEQFYRDPKQWNLHSRESAKIVLQTRSLQEFTIKTINFIEREKILKQIESVCPNPDVEFN